MENISAFLVKSPQKILIHLKTIAIDHCLIAANTDKNLSFLTEIVDFNEKEKIMTLSCSPKEYIDEELLNSDLITFKTEYDGIEVLFESEDIKKEGDITQPFFSMKIPDSIYWIQRREFYRVRVPYSKNSYCAIPLDYSNDKHGTKTFNLRLFDISTTGFSILVDTLELAEPFKSNAEFNNCKLVLDNTQSLTVSFVVSNKIALNPNHLNKEQRIGCAFLDDNSINTAEISKYMKNLGNEIRASLM